MNNRVKKAIEINVELLDTNLPEFIERMDLILNPEDFVDLIVTLESASISTSEIRYNILHRHIEYETAYFYSRDMLTQPLRDWMNTELSKVGFNDDEVLKYIIDHKDDFKNVIIRPGFVDMQGHYYEPTIEVSK